MSTRSKLIRVKLVKQNFSIDRPLLPSINCQAPLTAHSLLSNSKWLIVRHNLHKIRSWGVMRHMSTMDKKHQDWYLFFQMRRELKRAEEQIRAIQCLPNFSPIRYFELPIDDKLVRRYNVSHVKSSDGIYYAGLGSEPIVLQSLLYYFSREYPVTPDGMFYSFLSDVNAVLNTNRQRLNRTVILRRIAFNIALAVIVLLLLMFFSLILSVITTMTKLKEMYHDHSHVNRHRCSTGWIS